MIRMQQSICIAVPVHTGPSSRNYDPQIIVTRFWGPAQSLHLLSFNIDPDKAKARQSIPTLKTLRDLLNVQEEDGNHFAVVPYMLSPFLW